MNTAEVIAARIEEVASGDRAFWIDELAALVDELPYEGVPVAEDWARAALQGLSTPLRSGDHADLQGRRSVLTRLAAEAAARLERPDELFELLLAD